MLSRRDPNTLSNYEEYVTEHTVTNFNINFEKQRLEGSVKLTLKRLAGAKSIVLDANYLDIQQVLLDGKQVSDFKITKPEGVKGGTLTIPLDDKTTAQESVDVTVKLETTEKCTALQWLTPEQTSNKKHPYMFSQCQPIHARSIFPCQDTPAVKSTFENTFRSQLPVLNSGLDNGVGNGEYKFKQEVPLPSYLYSIASGDIARAPIGKHSEVATSPDGLAAAKWEFEEDMDKFLAAIAKILPSVPYAWGTYNVLVLPPSFPYGGMENPIWTFATPTVISGDRQNVDVIAHELSHSWSGNLVSCKSWESFWLNEGWTTYLERRIIAELHGEPQFHFSAIIGWKALTDSIQEFGENHPFTSLCVDLEGKDPDDAFSSIPYEKGFTFLYYLDRLVGRTKWDTFANFYFSTFARKSLDAKEFRQTLVRYFKDDEEVSAKLNRLDWDTWYFKPGFPPKPDFDTSLVDVCYALADKWLARASGSAPFEPKKSDIDGWSANQVVVFLERVQLFEKPLAKADSRLLSEAYGLSSSQNVEILSRYFSIGLTAADEEVFEPTASLLGRVGRMKFVRPLYRQLNAVNPDLAKKTFEKNEAFYHPVCRAKVHDDLFGKGL